MDFHIQENTPTRETLTQIAQIWNANATARHAFYPWTSDLLLPLLTDADGSPVGHLFTAHHTPSNEMIGFIHHSLMREDGYPRAGVVEAIMVDAPYRRSGVGTALLAAAVGRMERSRPRPMLIDALGAWPFGYAFNTLADGSERSGVFLSEPAVYRLFRAAGFDPARRSTVMRADIRAAEHRPVPEGCGFYIGRRTERTWLDRVFRGRVLHDHDLVRGADRRVMSRSIFGLMDGESRREGQVVFSLFGVNTPFDMQRKGYAGINLAHLMEHVKDLGGETLELHVYADNDPALALYRSLGFAPVAETVMMHRRLS